MSGDGLREKLEAWVNRHDGEFVSASAGAELSLLLDDVCALRGALEGACKVIRAAGSVAKHPIAIKGSVYEKTLAESNARLKKLGVL